MKNNIIAFFIFSLCVTGITSMHAELNSTKWFSISNYALKHGNKEQPKDRQAVLEAYRSIPNDHLAEGLAKSLAPRVEAFTGLDSLPPRYATMERTDVCQETQRITTKFDEFLKNQNIETRIIGACQ